ncbi:MAG: hypothetical protein HY755_01730 [Nitrospirae bacterium]|nr:hypothetical protein [Nitrospirota bacterium]
MNSIFLEEQSAENKILNYDLQRIRQCAVHYSAVDGKLYPFCTYNSGHTFRNCVERQYVEDKKS